MNNTPTPRTHAEIEDWVNGLNHMADDHLCCRATVLDTAELIKELRSERNQLRKMLDAFAQRANLDWRDRGLISDYLELPYVKARRTK